MPLDIAFKRAVWTLFLILTLISLASPSAWAGCSGHSCSDVTVTRIVARASGEISIGTSGDESKLTCDSGNNGYIDLPPDSDVVGFNQIYAMLLSAQARNHPLWIRTNESGECQVVYVVSDQ